MSRRLRRRDERGAVLVIFAAFVIVAVLMLAFVIDIGGLRQEKKEVTLSTDAAALAVASELVLYDFAPGTYDCSAVPVRGEAYDVDFADQLATEFLKANGETVENGCRVEVTGRRRGYVVIGGLEDVDYAFSGAVGQKSGRVSGVSASVARVDSGGGLRPIGVCAVESSLNVDGSGDPFSMHDDVIDAPKNGDGVLDQPIDMVLKKDHLKKDEDSCDVEDAAGQRGQLDLGNDGTGAAGQCMNSNVEPGESTFNSDMRYGYWGTLANNAQINQDPGDNFNSVTDCLTADIQSKQLFWLPVYDGYNKTTQTFHITHFVQAQVTGFCLVNGAQYYPSPPPISCRLPVDGEAQPVEWLRYTITRVVEFTPEGPPLTDDSLRDSPAICAEKDEPALLDACVPPDPPVPWTPPPPQPPPAECAVSAIVIGNPVPKKVSGGNLQHDLSVEATIDNFALCGVLDMHIVRASDGAGKSDFQSETPGAIFSASETKSFSAPWVADTYRIEVLEDDNVIGSLNFTLTN